jgi:hypothetical protein
MNNICAWLICLGVLASLGLIIWVLVKQNDCCKNEGYVSKKISQADCGVMGGTWMNGECAFGSLQSRPCTKTIAAKDLCPNLNFSQGPYSSVIQQYVPSTKDCITRSGMMPVHSSLKDACELGASIPIYTAPNVKRQTNGLWDESTQTCLCV